jgi:DNA polymerase III subunit delta
MRLNQAQLGEHLAKGLESVYVLLGDEPLAQSEILDTIRLKARQLGYEERTSYTADRAFNWQQISHFAQSSSLFTNLRLLEISIPSGKPGVDGGKILKDLAQNRLIDTTVLLLIPSLDKDTKNSAWFSALDKHAVIIEMKEVSVQQLPQWIAKRLKQQHQETNEETLLFLAHQVEGNLLGANQEILKLGLLYPQGALSLDQVKDSVLSVSRHDAFQLGEAVLAGDTARTVKVLQALQDEGEQPLAVMNPLLWRFKPLAELKLAQTRGENLGQAMTHARVFGSKQDAIKRAVTKLSLRQIEAILQKLAEIDQIAKGVMEGDPWLEISRLCFGLSTLCAR